MTTHSRARHGAQAEPRVAANARADSHLRFLARLTLATIAVATARALGLPRGSYPIIAMRERGWGPPDVPIGDLFSITDVSPLRATLPMTDAVWLFNQLRRLQLAMWFDDHRTPARSIFIAAPYSVGRIAEALREAGRGLFETTVEVEAALPPGATALLRFSARGRLTRSAS